MTLTLLVLVGIFVSIMENVYHYIDFRKFLANFYNQKKEATSYFTFRYFSQKVGFKSPNQMQLIIQGKRNLTEPALFRCAEVMGLNAAETEYFKDLVGFGQAKTVEEKNFYYQRLLDNKKCKDVKQLEKEQFEYLSNWYHCVVRELIAIEFFKGDFQTLAKKVWPGLTASQVKKSVELLERLGLIQKNPDGTYGQTSAAVTTGPETKELSVVKYHQEMLDISKRALSEKPLEDTNVSALTLGISRETYHKIDKELQSFHQRILAMAAKDQKPDQVYQLNFQLFPLSKKKGEA